MAKLPKFSEFTDVQGMMNKVKSAVDSIMGPGNAEATEEAIAKETDPIKSKLLEVDLLINQIQDVQIIQTKSINALKSKYAEAIKLFETKVKQDSAPDKATNSSQTQAPKPDTNEEPESDNKTG